MSLSREELIPLDQMDEQALISLLEANGKSHSAESEIAANPSFYEVMTDKSNGRRLCYAVGKNPYYVASLWRADEFADE